MSSNINLENESSEECEEVTEESKIQHAEGNLKVQVYLVTVIIGLFLTKSCASNNVLNFPGPSSHLLIDSFFQVYKRKLV